MTPEETKAAAEIMLAAAQGKRIEFRSRRATRWMLCLHTPGWNWESYDYRVAPEPFEGWVNVYPDMPFGYTYPSKEEAEATRHFIGGRTIRVREVIE